MAERTETPEQRAREQARYGRVRRAGMMERLTATASVISSNYHSWADKNGNSCELRLAAMIERALVALADDLMEGND
jgi:hypothetical protein